MKTKNLFLILIIFLGVVFITACKKKEEPLPVVPKPVEKKVSKEVFVQEFLFGNYLEIVSEDDSIVDFIPVNVIGVSGNIIVLKYFKECCYSNAEAYEYASKYRMPSVVQIFPSESQLGISFVEDLVLYKKPGYKIKFEKGARDFSYSFPHYPAYIVKLGEEFWIFDQNREEMPKW